MWERSEHERGGRRESEVDVEQEQEQERRGDFSSTSPPAVLEGRNQVGRDVEEVIEIDVSSAENFSQQEEGEEEDEVAPTATGTTTTTSTPSASTGSDLPCLAFSGGGIRSACICAGVLDAYLHHFNHIPPAISCVSGGGFVGASFVQWMTARKDEDWRVWKSDYFNQLRKNVGYLFSCDCRTKMLTQVLWSVTLIISWIIVFLMSFIMPGFVIAVVFDGIIGESARDRDRNGLLTFLIVFFALSALFTIISVGISELFPYKKTEVAIEEGKRLRDLHLRENEHRAITMEEQKHKSEKERRTVVRKRFRVVYLFRVWGFLFFCAGIITGSAWAYQETTLVTTNFVILVWIVVILLLRVVPRVTAFGRQSVSIAFLIFIYGDILDFRIRSPSTTLFLIPYSEVFWQTCLAISAVVFVLHPHALGTWREEVLHKYYQRCLRTAFFYKRDENYTRLSDLTDTFLYIAAATVNMWELPGRDKRTFEVFLLSRGGGEVLDDRVENGNEEETKRFRETFRKLTVADAMTISASALANNMGRIDPANLFTPEISLAGVGLGKWVTGMKKPFCDTRVKTFLFSYVLFYILYGGCVVITVQNGWYTAHPYYNLRISSILVLVLAFSYFSIVSVTPEKDWFQFGGYVPLFLRQIQRLYFVGRGVPGSVYLSDGGHSENLALAPMLKCKPKKVYVMDAATDPERTFEDLLVALEHAREKLKCHFFMKERNEEDKEVISSLDLATELRRHMMPSIQEDLDAADYHLPSHFRFFVRYHNTTFSKFAPPENANNEEGEIVYMKPRKKREDLPLYGCCCVACHDKPFCSCGMGAFPNNSTGNQCLTRLQYDAYHNRGKYTFMTAVRDIEGGGDNVAADTSTTNTTTSTTNAEMEDEEETKPNKEESMRSRRKSTMRESEIEIELSEIS